LCPQQRGLLYSTTHVALQQAATLFRSSVCCLWTDTVLPPLSMCRVCCAARVHNEALALHRLSADHHSNSGHRLKAGGSINSTHSQQSASSQGVAANGTAAALPKAV
jgi:hypothetical protein